MQSRVPYINTSIYPIWKRIASIFLKQYRVDPKDTESFFKHTSDLLYTMCGYEYDIAKDRFESILTGLAYYYGVVEMDLPNGEITKELEKHTSVLIMQILYYSNEFEQDTVDEWTDIIKEFIGLASQVKVDRQLPVQEFRDLYTKMSDRWDK